MIQKNAQLPDTGFLRLPAVMQFVPFSRSMIYQKMKLGEFPKPVRFGARTVAWRAEDIHEWIKKQGQESGGQA
jgi:predicted DNA-binding transcriptional regulator AlpA